ncbi:hypothetical protein [Mucilaginibacter terrae]|uniref:DUF2782 domain-containing protein n=1 Tax=Mucilaginibacter terrae TaxID=1955052 RepID=A0ABU3GUP3_9SPHI|nr:hypothetical protein [Mucilaginibacter terrae]MDT3403501.1 hypothetical protein [Mucilaginibacter terrae]
MKMLTKLTLVAMLFTVVNTMAQTQPKQTKTTAIITQNQGAATVYKDETGKELKTKQVMEYVHTGNYKIEKAVGKDKKPFMLVKKSPGYNRRPVAEAVVVKPL